MCFIVLHSTFTFAIMRSVFGSESPPKVHSKRIFDVYHKTFKIYPGKYTVILNIVLDSEEKRTEAENGERLIPNGDSPF